MKSTPPETSSDRFKEISSWVSSAHDLNQHLELIMGTVSQMMRAKWVSLMLVDHESETLFQQAALCDMKPVDKERTVSLGQDLAGYVAEKGEPMVVPDVLQDGRWENEISDFIDEKHKKYFFDTKDHCLYLLDSINSLFQKLESGENFYFSYQGHRMNQVMKTLTVVATIFIPLTFIAGIYGMNFEYIPELSWKWGYFGLWGIMAILFIAMVIYFRKNKWF